MNASPTDRTQKVIGRVVGLVVIAGAIVTALMAFYDTDKQPRTDDASVRANFIAIAPEVGGRLIALPVKDNAYVKKGDLLFAIDPRDYEYALKQALSDQNNLEQRIIDTQRKIAGENSAVEAASATLRTSETAIKTAASAVDLAKATVTRAQANVDTASAHLSYSTNDFHRIQPLLAKQYVTVDQVDQADTAVRVAKGQYEQAQAALAEAQSQEKQAELKLSQATDQSLEFKAKLGQAMHVVDTPDILESQRPSLAAKVERARLDLERSRVVAPFDAYVTNLNISEGAYAHAGSAMFTLIDARTWWVVANYREGKIRNIHVGSKVDVYLMGHPDRRFDGVVQSLGYGVFPEDGNVADGLPNIQRTLNWVHLSTRFPVRILIQNPDPALFRIGATALTIVR
ncbi:MAG TPA: biotin/lipoyl-binding protein [Candidatus Paceibacterota bacterium]|jgi:multidrug efflux system membrane fusion protein|nr:biotin/lipoyl-binding protein [Candidatus Paceibacterota bacterium]